MRKIIISTGLLIGLAGAGYAQKKTDYIPKIHGTIRGKYEYQYEEKEGRFEVRNARFSLTGNVAPIVSYKAEIDLSDEGAIKMLDAYARVTPLPTFDITIGQMRVPFTIDAHRSPHQQYFANRSFIAKQVGNVRDVGATLAYTLQVGIPIRLEAGIFNGSGLTDQKDFWTNRINYSAKAHLQLPKGFNLVGSVQKISPEKVDIHMYDIGAYYQSGRWHVEAEFLRKHYANGTFSNVNAFNGFVCYDQPLPKVFQKISFLGRFDCMSDHSNGKVGDNGSLVVNDAARKRITVGTTLSLAKPFIADLRINYENYFYKKDAVVAVSEKDKVVIELMVRF